MKTTNRLYTLLYGDRVVPAEDYIRTVFKYHSVFLGAYPEHKSEKIYSSTIFFNFVKNELSKGKQLCQSLSK